MHPIQEEGLGLFLLCFFLISFLDSCRPNYIHISWYLIVQIVKCVNVLIKYHKQFSLNFIEDQEDSLW